MGWLPWVRLLARVCTDRDRRLRASSWTEWSLIMVGLVTCSWFLSEGANSTVCTREKVSTKRLKRDISASPARRSSLKAATKLGLYYFFDKIKHTGDWAGI